MDNTMETNLNGPDRVQTAGDGAPVTDKLRAKAHETIEKVARSSADAEHWSRERASEAANRVRETEERARQAADRSVAKASEYVQQNPLMSAGIAFVAGMLLSSILRR